jgi:hypothetical protein
MRQLSFKGGKAERWKVELKNGRLFADNNRKVLAKLVVVKNGKHQKSGNSVQCVPEDDSVSEGLMNGHLVRICQKQRERDGMEKLERRTPKVKTSQKVINKE